jgi:hypothetical protein
MTAHTIDNRGIGNTSTHIQWSPSNPDTLGTQVSGTQYKWPDYGGILFSGVWWVWLTDDVM